LIRLGRRCWNSGLSEETVEDPKFELRVVNPKIRCVSLMIVNKMGSRVHKFVSVEDLARRMTVFVIVIFYVIT
jgi:hypothetical protein